jgi:mannose-6-phosphate isomerase-like protein (cupin superfamily)
MKSKDGKQRLFEVMQRVDKTFKPRLNEEEEPVSSGATTSGSTKSEKRGFHTNIEKDTVDNTNFRKVLYTGEHLQLVLMSLKPEEEIGMETHPDIDQFFRFDAGTGKAIINGNEYEITDGDCIIIPAGSEHNIINTGEEELKMYTIYTPPHHKEGTLFATKDEAEGSDEKFDGKTTE